MTDKTENPPILSFNTKRTTLHPFVSACLAIVFIPEMLIVFAIVLGFINDIPEAFIVPLGAIGFLAIPLICTLMSWRAIYQIERSRDSQKGLPFVIGTLILSIFHLLFGGFLALLAWELSSGKW
jgi:hypothetical protein